MFTRLGGRLTMLYATLFGAALLAVAALVHVTVSASAERVARNELGASAAVFRRVWSMQAGQLNEAAEALAREPAFRTALARGDVPALELALDHRRGRLQLGQAFIVTVEGEVIGPHEFSPAEGQRLRDGLKPSLTAEGVLMLAGLPHLGVSTPILVPELAGWIVFAAPLHNDRLTAFEALAAIALEATVLVRDADGSWRAADPALDARDLAEISARLLQQRNRTGSARLALRGRDALAQLSPLEAFDGGDGAALLLRTDRDMAYAPAPLLAGIALIGALAAAGLALASWLLARAITRPIAALEAAARALAQGKRVKVSARHKGEIGSLARCFNAMSDAVAMRETRITHIALHDTDTDLPNRRALERAINAFTGPGAIIALSVEQYDQIRGAIGYQLTARLISELGARIRALAPHHRMGRLTSDTIGLAVPGLKSNEALAFALELREAASGALRVGGVAIDIALSAGVAPVTRHRDHAALNHALIAVEQARGAHRTAALFDAEAYGDPAKNLSLMSEMIEGINHGALSLHYQPKLDLRTRRIAGAEGLVRWRHPTRGPIAPDVFVTMAERTGHIHSLTEWSLIQAIADQRIMRAAGLDLTISVNLSGRLIGDNTFTDVALSLIDDTDASLSLEITETAAMHDPDAAMRNIARYTEAGVKISIDDFGAGLSSLDYLKRIRAHELKLDKSFTETLTPDSRAALLVRTGIELAHGLGMSITAEGVETAVALETLATMGCDHAQGYHIGRPQPPAALISQLRSPPTRASA